MKENHIESESDYKCKICGNKYTDQCKVIEHCIEQHMNTYWGCIVCGVKIVANEDARRHIESHHYQEKRNHQQADNTSTF